MNKKSSKKVLRLCLICLTFSASIAFACIQREGIGTAINKNDAIKACRIDCINNLRDELDSGPLTIAHIGEPTCGADAAHAGQTECTCKCGGCTATALGTRSSISRTDPLLH